MSKLNVFQYWGQGKEGMPEFIRKIYEHNKDLCVKNDIELILLDDKNITEFITPHSRFFDLAYNFKSDVIRYYILDKYGGFWFDTDVIIIKDLNTLYSSLQQYECMLDVEYNTKIGCASLYIKKNSKVSNFCVEYVNDVLKSKEGKGLGWNDIGPNTVTKLWNQHRNDILLNDGATTKSGCNFSCWSDNPGINKTKWYLQNSETAKQKSQELERNKSCYYLITWTIYRKHDMKDKLCDVVFNDGRSVYSYFID